MNARVPPKRPGTKDAYSPEGYEIHQAWCKARAWAQRRLAEEYPERFAELLREGAQRTGAMARVRELAP